MKENPFNSKAAWKCGRVPGFGVRTLILIFLGVAFYVYIASSLFALVPEENSPSGQAVGEGMPAAGPGDGRAPEKEPFKKSLAGSRGRIAKRVLSLPFRDDAVYEVFLGYGLTLELLLPEKVENIVPPDEQLVSADYVGTKAYLKGIAYGVGESTNVHINTTTGKTLHLKVTLVDPEESDHAFKFIPASKTVFTKSHVQNEIAKERKKLEEEMQKREANLGEVTEKLAEDRLKLKLLKEERHIQKKKIKKSDLEMSAVQTSRVGEKVYVKLVIKNVSGRDFSVSSILLARAVYDPRKPEKILGYENIETDPPTLESEVIAPGDEVKALLAFAREELRPGDRIDLKIIEAGGSGRVAEFKNMDIFSSR